MPPPFIKDTPPPEDRVFIQPTGARSLQSMSVKELMSSGRPPAELVAEANRRFNSGDEGQIEGALNVLRWAATTLHSPAAFATMARIFDPNWVNRPQGLQPDPSLAAQDYRAAFMEGETSVSRDREALRKYLEDRARGNGAEAASAAAILDRFWR